MYKLTTQELDDAFNALNNHGINGFLPEPPEWALVRNDWENIRTSISQIDLDTYLSLGAITTYAEKKKTQLRPITLLHIQDTVIYTSLVMVLRDCIEAQRLPMSAKKSFSYRAPAERGVLYKSRGAFEQYRRRTSERIALAKTRFVTTIDISDFFPRIYQHRLENALDAASDTARHTETVRVLMKLLGRFSGGRSYGIPTGPFASRNLAEAVLIDVDSTLQGKGIDFVRWVDDFTIFTRTEEEAQEIIFFIASWLHDKHGLSLNSSKTAIYEKSEFIADVWKSYDEEREEFRRLVREVNEWAEYDDDTAEDGEALDADALQRIFELSLTIESEPKYGLVRFLLERGVTQPDLPRETQQAVLRSAIENAKYLSPVSDSILTALIETNCIPNSEMTRFSRSMFRVFRERETFQAGQQLSWLCWFVGEARLTGLAAEVRRLAENTADECVRREALIALSKIGTRADVVDIKDRYNAFPPTVRPALALASRQLGADERKFWRREIPISDQYDKLVLASIV